MRETFKDGVVLDGRFKTVSPLNHGSFGMVFMATDLKTNEPVAIKCLTKKTAVSEPDHPFSVDERSEELLCHARLGSHPNIVNLVHSFETDAHIFIVLEFCARGDLYEAIRTDTGPLETEHVRHFMLQLVDAVAYIHSKGMYHRDIKPENIFLTQTGDMKLGDFGLATTEKWTFETTVGSDRYMSPEQYDSDGDGYSPEHADIWAIGICLLNILFSRNPFSTPTESDPLFLDFARDRQSLFDVFPSMSQDTYEIIANCMSLDPRKRSLEGAREALERLVSFTTFDDPLDDFCSAESRVIANSHREPLRTPSVQKATREDNGSFPWAKALHQSPQMARQLSAIPDNESYQSEDLFEKESGKDWFSVGQHTPSMSSMMSNVASSFKSLHIRRSNKPGSSRASLTPISGSLPVAMTKPKPLPSMSSLFGKKSDVMSKSWSDLWEEDVEEEEAKQLQARKDQNARTYSQESLTIRVDTLKAPATSEINEIPAGDVDADIVADGFFFQSPQQVPLPSPRYSPPPRRSSFDKWSALGERRRAYTGGSDAEKPAITPSGKERRNAGAALGIHDGQNNHHYTTNKVHNSSKDKVRSGMCPWMKGRVRDQGERRGKRTENDLGDLEWVGGMHNLHL